MRRTTSLLLVFALIGYINATEVQKCKGGNTRKLGADEVTISNCEKNKCILRRKSDASITIKLKPEEDIKTLTNEITGIILGVPLPFPGVYGTSACDNIYDAEGTNKVGCPMKAGEIYTYKTSFRIQEFYPTVSLVVHWALNDGSRDRVCFEIPARIK